MVPKPHPRLFGFLSSCIVPRFSTAWRPMKLARGDCYGHRVYTSKYDTIITAWSTHSTALNKHCTNAPIDTNVVLIEVAARIRPSRLASG